jgi:hypothetical protein
MTSKTSMIKLTVKTKFRIDYTWWEKYDRNWRNSLISYLCPEHKAAFASHADAPIFDLVDPETGEVSQGDALVYTLVHHCAQQDDFISLNAPLVDSIFKIFLSNDNQALSPEELAEVIRKPANTILTTIGGLKVYKGIRPIFNS